MASVNWQKVTMPKAGALRVHLGKEERTKYQHSNEDIDKSKSYLNTYIGCNDYVGAYQALKRRVAEVDELYPVPAKGKKGVNERIVGEMLTTYCPQAIYDMGRSEEFFEASHKVFQDYFGKENVCGSCTNYDEMHNYIDPENQERTSLAHMHTLVACYAEWTDKDRKTGKPRERRGINGANFEKRSKYNELNKAMDEMCFEKFGMPYRTGNGKGKGGSRKTVEALKTESATRAAKKANDDYVRSLTPTPTKTVKKLGGVKEVPKTEEELKRDRDVLAAQEVLRGKDEIAAEKKRIQRERAELEADNKKLAEYVAEHEAEFKDKAAKMREDFQAKITEIKKQSAEQISQLEVENLSLKEQLKEQLKSAAIAVAIRVRTFLEKIGVHWETGHTVDDQVRAALTLEQTERSDVER